MWEKEVLKRKSFSFHLKKRGERDFLFILFLYYYFCSLYILFYVSNDEMNVCFANIFIQCTVDRNILNFIKRIFVRFFCKAKLRYDPIELDPEEMCRMASEQPQVANGVVVFDDLYFPSVCFCLNKIQELA